MASPMPQPGRREYPFSWPMPVRATVRPMHLPMPGLPINFGSLLTRNTDIDLRRAEFAWTPTHS